MKKHRLNLLAVLVLFGFIFGQSVFSQAAVSGKKKLHAAPSSHEKAQAPAYASDPKYITIIATMTGLREKRTNLEVRRDQLRQILDLKRAAKQKAVNESAEFKRVLNDLGDVNTKLASLEAQRLTIVQSYQNAQAVK